MAAVAVRLSVDDEAAQSDQFRVLASHVDEVWRNAQADFRQFIVRLLFIRMYLC
jgi:hypothetical protein